MGPEALPPSSPLMNVPVLIQEPCCHAPEGSLIFLHGAGGHHGIWEGVVRTLGSLPWLRVRVDLPGHGRARDLPPATRADLLLPPLREALETLPEPRALVGHSMGGRLALALVREGLAVQGVLLVASVPHLPVHPGGPDPDPDRMCRRLFGLPRWIERCRHHLSRLLENPEVLQADFALIAQLNEMPLPQSVPGLEAVFGSREHLFSPSQILTLQERYPGTPIHTLPGAGHMLPLEVPRLLARQILSWLPRVTGKNA